jgi:hypothetical protein
MLVRKSWNISDINELDMHDFHMRGFEAGDNIDILLITGDRGYYNHYRVEIRFFSIAYIGCPTYFFGPDFVWRMPTEEEKREIQAYAYPLPNAQVYCIDSRHNPPKKFFWPRQASRLPYFTQIRPKKNLVPGEKRACNRHPKHFRKSTQLL